MWAVFKQAGDQWAPEESDWELGGDGLETGLFEVLQGAKLL